MIDLDDHGIYDALDQSRLRIRLRTMAEQCRKGWNTVPVPDLPESYRHVDRVVHLGMGGSAIAADYLQTVVVQAGGPPVEVFRGYEFPGPLDDKTLVIGSSYSGNTEETLSAFNPGLSGCKVAVTGGGRMEETAAENGIPVYAIDIVSEPRAALGYCLFTLLSCMNRLELVENLESDVEEAIELVERLSEEYSETTPTDENKAKMLAWQLMENLIVVYAGDIFSCVARRWKTQLNENGKSWAFYETLPEAGHNAVEGLERPGNISDQTHVVLLGANVVDERLQPAYDGIVELLNRSGVGQSVVEAEGESVLARIMSLTVLGDYASYYLGLLYGADPSPVPRINALKAMIEES